MTIGELDTSGGSGALASRNVPTAATNELVEDVRNRVLSADGFESVVDVAVLEDGRLVGLIRIEDLFRARGDAVAQSIMESDPAIVNAEAPEASAAHAAASHDKSSVGVVDSEGQFVGLIAPRQMLRVLEKQHIQDLTRMSGCLSQGEGARAASGERLALRFWHRFPWLLFGLLAAAATAAIVSSYERGLEGNLELVFFIPGVVYIAGAVGNQTVTLVVRGLSVGIPVGKVVRRELLTGAALGAALGILAYPLVLLVYDSAIALTVSASVWMSSAAATGIAVAFPWLFSKANADPAFGSGPVATVAQDVVSLATYFAFATWILL